MFPHVFPALVARQGQAAIPLDERLARLLVQSARQPVLFLVSFPLLTELRQVNVQRLPRLVIDSAGPLVPSGRY